MLVTGEEILAQSRCLVIIYLMERSHSTNENLVYENNISIFNALE
jgi:hypothetical protein